jgi:hypothetical protein
MICKDNQELIDNLPRLKVDRDNDNNKIASIMSKPDSQRTREDNEELTVHIIEEIIQKGNNKDLINKIATVTKTSKKKGEAVQFLILLKILT